jgi:hypothetical protein
VPVGWVLNSQKKPAKILEVVGKVNDQEFPPGGGGYPAETLLLEEPHIEPRFSPLPPDGLLGAAEISAAEYVDVTIPMRYTDPKTNSTQARGHNVYPNPKDANGNWHRIFSTGGATRYQKGDFTQIFAKVS